MATNTKPVIKWVGGKTQILDHVLATFPPVINGDYIEPFVGGGSVLLAVLSSRKNRVGGKFIASDINADLVSMYINIRDNLEETILELDKLISPLSKEATDPEKYYYVVRESYRKHLDSSSPRKSAMLIFLNKLCFRGVYRVGPNGFNVPYGHPKNPGAVKVYDPEHLEIVSELIKPVIFKVCGYEDALMNAKDADFVYMDPPYVDTFTEYNKGGWNTPDHSKLFEITHKLPCSVVMSNSNTELVNSSFVAGEDGVKSVSTIDCKRRINSKNPAAMAKEVLIVLGV